MLTTGQTGETGQSLKNTIFLTLFGFRLLNRFRMTYGNFYVTYDKMLFAMSGS